MLKKIVSHNVFVSNFHFIFKFLPLCQFSTAIDWLGDFPAPKDSFRVNHIFYFLSIFRKGKRHKNHYQHKQKIKTKIQYISSFRNVYF